MHSGEPKINMTSKGGRAGRGGVLDRKRWKNPRSAEAVQPVRQRNRSVKLQRKRHSITTGKKASGVKFIKKLGKRAYNKRFKKTSLYPKKKNRKSVQNRKRNLTLFNSANRKGKKNQRHSSLTKPYAERIS